MIYIYLPRNQLFYIMSKKPETIKDFNKRMSREEKIQKGWQKKVNKANKHILTIIEDGKELDIDLIIERLEKIKETTILLRNSATLSHNAKFMAGRSSGIGTAIDLLKTIKKNNQTK